jgi:hypothetical protein
MATFTDFKSAFRFFEERTQFRYSVFNGCAARRDTDKFFDGATNVGEPFFLLGSMKDRMNSHDSPLDHFPCLTDPAEVAGLLRPIDGYKGTHIVPSALELAPLVFVRPGEPRSAKWEDIDLENSEWVFCHLKQRANLKTKRKHLVPLASQAVAILKDLQPLTGGGVYVFPGLRLGRPISDGTINKALRTLGYDTRTEITGHGFRAMARTVIAERLHLDPQ